MKKDYYYLDSNAQKEALEIARNTLTAYLAKDIKPKVHIANKVLLEKSGAFVTLTCKGNLRGCIGRFVCGLPLYQIIMDCVIDAAFHDPRFPSVTKEELKDIKIEISVMSPKKKINNWHEIELGKHGVVIQSGSKAGTFLPQVATDTGWNKEEFLNQLCTRKAGLAPNCYKDPNVNLYIFNVQIFKDS